MPLTTVAPGVWSTFSPVNFLGVPMVSRTTIADLGDGGLFVCSPGTLGDDVRREIDTLGEVRAIAAPNRFHHVFIAPWRAAYPDASLHVPASLVKKRPDLADAHTHGEDVPAVYGDVIAHRCMAGLPTLDETWFYHRPSRTLIDTDLMHNVHEDPSWIARAGWWGMGAWKKFGPSRLERMLVKDRAALRDSIDVALEWDFDRVLVAHGEVFEPSDVKDRVRASWHWLYS